MLFVTIPRFRGTLPNGGKCDACGAHNTPGFGNLTCAQCGAEIEPDSLRNAGEFKPWQLRLFWGVAALCLIVAAVSNSEVRKSVREFRIPISESSEF